MAAPLVRPFGLVLARPAVRHARTVRVSGRFSGPTKPLALQSALFRRSFAAAAASPEPRRRGGKVRTVFRWLWRGTYVSLIAGTTYFFYGVYASQWPADQIDPDPSKPTLVVLGTGWGSVALLKKLDTENFNVIVVSPRNYFLFTPLLPSCTTGTIEHRSIMEPVRNFLRHKKATVKFYEADATRIDAANSTVTIRDESEIKGASDETDIHFDELVVGVGAENATFGIPGVRENSCFLKEVGDAQAIRKRIMDCVETATFKGQSQEERKRLLHMVVVGGGPTGVEFAGELQDFFDQDLRKWVPEIADVFKVTLVEALPNVLPMFSKQLIDYTEKTFRDEKINVMTKTMVKNVTDSTIEAQVTKSDGSKTIETLPYGLLVWATGNAVRPLVKDLMNQLPAQKESRRGLEADENLLVRGTDNIYAVGDCCVAGFAPTAQVAGQQGAYLAKVFNERGRVGTLESELSALQSEKAKGVDSPELDGQIRSREKQLKRARGSGAIPPFHYTHNGSLAYIGSDRAVADISWMDGNFATGGSLTYLFWRSAYLSMVFSGRNRMLVIMDWLKAKMFGRDVSRE
ncbi:MAG: NADH:ubiquinone oxidoreductase [Vezdaea aestivalis]|nr:MAG: NADH:ubiquinone oxidoreductase [Vezdaea aestivalis]